LSYPSHNPRTGEENTDHYGLGQRIVRLLENLQKAQVSNQMKVRKKYQNQPHLQQQPVN
jgi:hypothetical protein